MITETQQSDSRFHIETDMGEHFATDRREALAFAKKHDSAEVWEIDGDCIYTAEA